jgi:peptidoglycan/xylan/chitin deacetylase (PgdA/CDA1 family)
VIADGATAYRHGGGWRSAAKGAAERFLVAVPRTVPARRAVVLAYHSVAPEPTRASTARSVFRSHLGWIAEHCEVVPFDGLGCSATRDGGGSRPTVAITFDDGYEDNHREALPLLTTFGLPATFFITTGLVDRDERALERLARAWGSQEPLLRSISIEQIREMDSAGMAFGAHTRTHPNLRTLDERALVDEIAGSRDRLEEILQRRVTAFAYPFGDARFHISATAVAVAATSGFTTAGTIEFGGVSPTTDPLLIPRFPVSNDPVEVLRAKVMGHLDPIGAWRERMPRWLTAPLSSGRRRGEGP